MKTKVYSRELKLSYNDKKIYNVIAKICATYDSRRVYRIKENLLTFEVQVKFPESNLYVHCLYKDSEAAAREYIEEALYFNSPEYGQIPYLHVSESIKRADTRDGHQRAMALTKVLDYIREHEAEDFERYPSEHHVYHQLRIYEVGQAMAEIELEDALEKEKAREA